MFNELALNEYIFVVFCRYWKDSSMSSRKRRFSSAGPKPFKKSFIESWISRMYFATFPVSTLGNWIPRVLSQWYCSGHGCGFDQIVIENAKGNLGSLLFVYDKELDVD